MCGIAGIVGGVVDDRVREAVARMSAAQSHRGPDAEGCYFDERSALGHRRLATIDLSPEANQPMEDANCRYVLVFNGEIYNFQEIRNELSCYQFKTRSDTEVILAAFIQWREKSIERLKGQFALAIWDKENEKLFVARDRLGEKPFYYCICGDVFMFASELRALLATDRVPRKVSKDGVVDYLVHESTVSPRTIVERVHQLPPGHYGWFSAGDFEVKRYWHPVPNRLKSGAVDYASACIEVRRLLNQAVDGQLVSDVPTGAFLSGGIDSSAIVALMSERAGQPVNTLSVTFDEKHFDETVYSLAVARRFRTKHHDIRLKADALLDLLPEYFASVDSPSVDGLNTFVVSKAARNAGLTVVLSGVGGDELFAGYDTFARYSRLKSHSYLWQLPQFWRGSLAQAIGWAAGSPRARKASALLTLKSFDAGAFYEISRCVFTPAEAEELVPGFSWDKLCRVEASLETDFASMPSYSQMSVMELTNYMQSVLLKDTDNMSMASSLEVRLPLCDYELVQYVLGLPDEYKRGAGPKQLLVDSLDGLLPSEIVNRPKMGFSFPWGRWIRNELRNFCRSEIADLAKRASLGATAVTSVWNRFDSGDADTGWSQIWALVALEQWLKHNKCAT
jgi:asparagine synthase (glutamine-hydrolysing)